MKMERQYSIDVLRIVSAIAVIIIHIVSSPVTHSTVDVGGDLVSNLSLIHNLMKWSVPTFFMITGYCVLKKEKCTYRYCFAHVTKYVCVLFTVGLFYALLEEVFIQKNFTLSILFLCLKNVISGNLWDHMWFVYSIIGIYLVMPVIHAFMQQGRNNICVLTTLLFAFNVFFPTIEGVVKVNEVLPFNGYLFYVCFGGVVAKINVSNKFLSALTLAGLSSIAFIVLETGNHKFGYNHLAICLMAVSIFLIVSRLNIKYNKCMMSVSNCTWGIYLIHPLFINIAVKVLKVDVLTHQPYLRLFVFAVIVLGVSYLCTYILRKTPLVKKLF